MEDVYFDYGYYDNEDYELSTDEEKLYSVVTTLAQMYYRETGDGVIDGFYSCELPDMVAFLELSEENEDILEVIMQEIVLNIKDILPTTDIFKNYTGKYTVTFMSTDNLFLGMIIF